MTALPPDEATFARLLDQLRPRLMLFAERRGVGPEAEDAVQETLIAALAGFRAGSFRHESSVETWLYRILRNKVADHFRAATRTSTHLVAIPDGDEAVHADVQRFDTLVHADPELIVLVHQVLDSLSDRHWLVLILNQRLGMTTKEIAPRLNLSTGRTGALLAEAKTLFRRGIRGPKKTDGEND